MNALTLLGVVLAGVNVLLALVLAVVYWRNHREIKSPFTLGLLLFAGFLVTHNAFIVCEYLAMSDTFMARGGGPFAIAEALLQTAAVGALLHATLR